MEWPQQHDPIAKDCGHPSRHMPTQTHVTLRDLKKPSDTWETHPSFSEFVEFCSSNFGSTTREEKLEVGADGKCRFNSEVFTHNDIKEEVKLFFDVAIDAAEKHFEPQRVKSMVHFAVAGEKETARAFCDWIEGKPISQNQFKSAFHNATIDLVDMISYFDSKVSVQQVRGFKEVRKF